MISLEYARTMAAYNRWMNDRLYELSASLTDGERKRDVGAFFKSIHGTLNHLLLADHLWLGRFTGQSFVVAALDCELYADFDELRREREKTDATILQWVSTLSNDALFAAVTYESLVDPQPRRHALWFALTHFFNHQTHHRGQLTSLLAQRGMDPGVTDLIGFPGAPASVAAR